MASTSSNNNNTAECSAAECSDLSDLNKLGACSGKEKINLRKLTLNKEYRVLSAKLLKLKWPSVLIELEDNVVFLPKRIAEAITPEHIALFKKQEYALVYTGEKDVGKANKAALVKFNKIK